MSDSSTRVALLGLGRAGLFHLQSLRMTDEAELACVYDIDAAKANQIAQQYRCTVASDAQEAIGRDDVDAVIVATPTDSHFEFVQQSLEAKKPVLTEKPLGRQLRQIDDCFRLSAQNETPLFVAFQRRFDPSFAALISAVQSGHVGQLQFVRCVSRDNPVPSLDYIRTSGGIFHDCMVHDLDIVAQIVGETPTHLSAFGTSFIPEIGGLDDFDSVVATLKFASGVTASVDINRKSVYGYDQRIEAFGDGGMLQADNQHRTTVIHATPDGFTRSPVDESFPQRYRHAYRAELDCFAKCARGEQEVPVTHADVRTNHLLAAGLEIAARESRVLVFDEIESAVS